MQGSSNRCPNVRPQVSICTNVHGNRIDELLPPFLEALDNEARQIHLELVLMTSENDLSPTASRLLDAHNFSAAAAVKLVKLRSSLSLYTTWNEVTDQTQPDHSTLPPLPACLPACPVYGLTSH